MEGVTRVLDERRKNAWCGKPDEKIGVGYAGLLRKEGCVLLAAEDTGLFAPYMELYIAMLEKQLSYDALKILGFDVEMMRQLAVEMAFMLDWPRPARSAKAGSWPARPRLKIEGKQKRYPHVAMQRATRGTL